MSLKRFPVVFYIECTPLKTTQGKYAIKVLNPQIMLRPTAMGNFIKSERIADIHMTDFSELEIENDTTYSNQSIDWEYYLHLGQENNLEWVNLLLENINNLFEWTFQANESAKLLASNMVISHRDLDPKNVLLIQDNPIIIDWECAGYVNPMYELIQKLCVYDFGFRKVAKQ